MNDRPQTLAPAEAAEKLAKKLAHQKSVKVEYKPIPGADHFFASHMKELATAIDDYLDRALRLERVGTGNRSGGRAVPQ